MIARIHKIWSDDSNSLRDIDLGAYQGLDLFWEQAPVVEEEDEKQKELILQNEELTKLDGKRRDTAGVREPRWVLRDTVRRKAERRVRKEAEQRGDPPPHDPRLLKIKDGGLLMLGTREGILKAAPESGAQKKKGGAEDVDSSRARYAVMVQTGDNEVSIANLGGWLTFRGESLTGAGSEKVSKRSSSMKRDQYMSKEDEATRRLPTTVISNERGAGGKRKIRRDEFDGYDEEDVGTGSAYLASDVLDTLQGGEGEEEADNEYTVRSDDEAGSDGRDDTRTFDVNNHDLDSSDEESEEEEEEEEEKELDEESKLKREKLLAKLRANKKNEQVVEEDSDVSDDEPTVSKTVQYLVSQKKITALQPESERITKKRERGEEPASEQPNVMRPRVAATDLPQPLQSGITESEVRTLLEQSNGRIKTKDLSNHFKKRIKGSATGKKDLIAILSRLVVKQNDEVEGMMYVLKGRQFA